MMNAEHSDAAVIPIEICSMYMYILDIAFLPQLDAARRGYDAEHERRAPPARDRRAPGADACAMRGQRAPYPGSTSTVAD